MMLNRSKEEIARDLTEEATRVWGPERAAAMKAEINKVADWISLVAPHQLDLEADEADYLVAPAIVGEVEE